MTARAAGVLYSIQYLRAAAAISVVVFHILQWRDVSFETARAGVDVFFVISGVIMWTISQGGGEARPGGFLWRRFTRVAPTYWIATLLLTAIVLSWPAFLTKVRPQWGHVLLSLAFIPHLDPAGFPFPILSPGWTLSYEALFYLVFAASLLAEPRRRPWIVTLALAAVVAAGLTLSDPLYIVIANPLLFEFAAGVWLGALMTSGRHPGAAWGAALLTAGLAAFVAMGVTGWRDEAWRFVFWGVPATLIVAGALSLEAAGKVPLWRPLRILGDSSFSLYLFHVIAVALVAHAVGWGRGALFVPLAVLAAVAAGLAGRALIERPLIAALRGRSAGRAVSPDR